MRIPLNNPPTPSTLFGVPDSNAAFGRHAGIDYPVGIGTLVYACISGQVSIVKNDQYHGNVVDIKNGDKWYRVMHLSSFVKTSGQVQEGDLIAYSGNTGLSTGPHVHWDVRTQYNPTSFAAFIDPLTLIKEEPMFNEGDRVNINNYLYGEDLKRHGDAVDLPYHDAIYKIFESEEFKIDSRVNDGDVGNLKASGLNSEAANNAKGKLWKHAGYDDFMPNFKNSGTSDAQNKLNQIKDILK